MRRLSWIPSPKFLFFFTVIHAAVGVSLLIWSFGAEMARFDSGEPPGRGEEVVELLAEVLLSPLLTTMAELSWTSTWFPGLLGYIPIALNSLLWAIVAWLLAAAASRVA